MRPHLRSTLDRLLPLPRPPGGSAAPRSHSWRGILACAGAAVAFLPSLRALDPAKSVFQFNCHNWTREAGLPADKIAAVTQTPDGYIWLGSQNGLVRFDGSEFKVVPVDLPQAQGQDIQQLELAPNGWMWFSIATGGYGSFDGTGFAAIGDPRWTAPGINSRTIHAGRDGAIWTGSVYGWGRWMPGKPEQTFYDDKLGPVLMITEDSSGRIWMGTAERGLFYWVNGRFEPFPDEALKKENIRAVAQDAGGDLWVGTGRGLWRYDAHYRLRKVYFPAVQTTTLLLDRHGVLWAGTNESGLARYEDDGFTFLRKADGLGSDSVTSLCEDREGSLWIGTVDGLSQLSDLKFPIYTAKEGLVQGEALTVAASAKGGLWISTSKGASYFDGKTFRNYHDDSLLPNHYVTRIFEARNGDVYLVDGDKNINVLVDGRLSLRYANNSWPEAFAEDAGGVIGGIGPKLVRIHEGTIQPFAFRGEEPLLDWVNHLCVAKDGALWVATNNGLFRIADGKFERWSTANGLSANRVHYVFEDVDGSMWAGLSTGMARIKDRRVRNITVKDGLPDSRLYAIVPDDHGFFWVTSGRGIFRASRESLNAFADGKSARVQCEIFDGLESVKFSDRTEQGFSGVKTLDGRVWFPNPRGVVMIDPGHFFTNRIPPPVHIQKVSVDGRELKGQGPAVLDVGDHRVEFVFTALSYIASKQIHLRYQLKGYDPAWLDAGAHRSVVYSNLKAGRYTFAVEAANADGVWNTVGDSYSLELPTPFRQTAWFYGLLGLGGVLILAGGYRWKMRQLRTHQQKLQAEKDRLELKVGERTSELARSLSLLHATIESVTDGIMVVDLSGRVIFHNTRFAAIWRFPAGLLELRTAESLRTYIATQLKDPARFLGEIAPRNGGADGQAFDLVELNDGRIFERYIFPQRIGRERVGNVINWRDVTARKQAEAELHQIHRQLLDVSRQAGMAEVATGVLHNVGNVLNSVNVSATLVSDHVRRTKAVNIAKIAGLFDQHQADLVDFLTSDPRGRMIPGYLGTLAESLVTEQKTLVTELDHLRKNVEHIKEIVAMQQAYATTSGVSEAVAVPDLIEDALRINADSLARHDIMTVRDYQARPVIRTDKHKVMQILINLVRNAKFACVESGRPDRQLTVRTTSDGRVVRIAMIDNGTGIPAENLTRIFNHGFTTREGGHGFGLHSAALAARELGGSLNVESDGPGRGATFILELPAASLP